MILRLSFSVKAQNFAVPTFYFPKFNPAAIAIILPASLVVVAEHIGHLFVTSNIVGRDLAKDPGLHRSLMGNGLSTIFPVSSAPLPIPLTVKTSG